MRRSEVSALRWSDLFDAEHAVDLWTVFAERFVMPFKLVAAWMNW